jgi:hypothetical protein
MPVRAEQFESEFLAIAIRFWLGIHGDCGRYAAPWAGERLCAT